MDTVRYHPAPVIDALLHWCDANASEQPEAVVAVGLAFVHGFNEHQIVAARITTSSEPMVIDVPLARRAADIRRARLVPVSLDAPEWLAAAATVLVSERAGREPGALLYRRRRLNIALNPSLARDLVAHAGAQACGRQVSCMSLNQTRIAAALQQGLPFALFASGYADSWAARLTAAKPVLRLARLAA